MPQDQNLRTNLSNVTSLQNKAFRKVVQQKMTLITGTTRNFQTLTDSTVNIISKELISSVVNHPNYSNKCGGLSSHQSAKAVSTSSIVVMESMTTKPCHITISMPPHHINKSFRNTVKQKLAFKTKITPSLQTLIDSTENIISNKLILSIVNHQKYSKNTRGFFASGLRKRSQHLHSD